VGAALLAGLGLGLLVAAEVGPISLLCIRSTLRHGWPVGVAIGLGAATVDVLYALLGAAGAAALLQVDALRVGLGVLGACVLGAIGARTLWSAFRVRGGAEATSEVASPLRAYATAVAATASNPLTIASWAAVFSAASTADLVASTSGAAAFLAGVALGSAGWFVLLSGSVALGHGRVGERGLRLVDGVAGVGLLGFAGLLAVGVLRD
jgi:putative LysE/RhtB family amino acid efflux pump